jgi:DNA-binding transcriptional LysR family regulator
VSALEEHFGTRLVQRSTHAVTLTEGRDLVPAAQQLVDSADALQERTGRRHTKPVGRVRLSVPVPLGLYFSSMLISLVRRDPFRRLDKWAD